MNKMTIEILPAPFSVCQVGSYTDVDLTAPYTFTATTDAELSLVCPTDHVPAHTLQRQDGWIAMRITGVLDFSLIGILADITDRLARARVSVFALSTYNTDYILIRQQCRAQAVQALAECYQLVQG